MKTTTFLGLIFFSVFVAKPRKGNTTLIVHQVLPSLNLSFCTFFTFFTFFSPNPFSIFSRESHNCLNGLWWRHRPLESNDEQNLVFSLAKESFLWRASERVSRRIFTKKIFFRDSPFFDVVR